MENGIPFFKSLVEVLCCVIFVQNCRPVSMFFENCMFWSFQIQWGKSASQERSAYSVQIHSS